MHPILAEFVAQDTPKFNKEVVNGLACTYLTPENIERYLDHIFRSASKSFPAGLTYEGYARCTPFEEYCEMVKSKTNSRQFELAQTNIYFIKFMFSYNGEPIHPPRYVWLPYVEDAGTMHIGGALYQISPVLSDKVISPGRDTVFVRLLRDKLIFLRCMHSVSIDGVRENSYVVWSKIYRNSKEKRLATTKALPTVPHYLFAKYGFSECFQKYVGFVPVVGTDITRENYPESDWVICESSSAVTKVPPPGFMGVNYTPSNIKLAIPRDKWSPLVKSFVAGLYYVIDHFSDRWKPEWLDDKRLWIILLGHIYYSGIYGDNKNYTLMSEHFNSLDEYADPIIIEKLRESGHVIEDFYDLMVLLMDKYNSFIHDTGNSVLSMYGKSLEVLYYVLLDITTSIFTVNFKLNRMAKRAAQTSRVHLSLNAITETFNRYLTPGKIFKIRQKNVAVEPTSYSGDNKYPKFTSKIVEQEANPGLGRNKSGKKRKVISENNHLDISMVEAGSILFLSKNNPSPASRINPYVRLDLATSTIVPNPEFKELIDSVAKKFLGYADITDFSEDIEQVEVGDSD